MPEPAPTEAAVLPRAYNVSLLRLRMRLALLTMAVLPTTLAMALAHSTLSAHSVTDHLRAQDQAVAAGRLLDARLERVAATVLTLAANPVVVNASADPAAAADHARAVLGVPAVPVERLSVVDRRGRELVLVTAGSGWSASAADSRSDSPAGEDAALGLAPGELEVRVGGGARPTTVVLTTPLLGEGTHAGGALTAAIPLRGLLDAISPNVVSSGELLLVDHAGGTLLDSARPADVAVEPPGKGSVLATLAGRADGVGHWQLDNGWTASSVALADNFAGWRVVLLEHVAAPQLPLALLALLGALSLLLVGITVWMSRQVLRPAQELALSREQLLRLYEAARDDALRDGLTGLGNHRAFQEELEQHVEAQRRYELPFALVLIDLDDLKLVNDSEGHAAGDELIRAMGKLIDEIKRQPDRAFRIGGDEFAILMPHTSAEGALKFGRRLLYRAMNSPVRPMRFSGGVSACPELASSRDDVFAQADAALYWCKRHGRASLDIFDPGRDRTVKDEAAASQAAQVARLIAGRLLRAAYQPVVDLRSGRVIGFEGLSRPLPESGFADPGSLFAAAEAVGRTVELDRACVEAVVAQATEIAPDQVLSINLSPRTVEAPQFSAEWLTGLLHAHQMDPRRVIIELTEHQSIEDLPRLQRNLIALQRAGVRVAVDDVGAGNAGLRLLSQFRFDIVKIDLSLVQDGTRRDSSRAVLTSLQELAGRWNAYVVAEGIETVDQLRVVREMGLAAGQGYLLGRPGSDLSLRSIDIAFIEAGGVVMEVRPPVPGMGPRAAPAQAPVPATLPSTMPGHVPGAPLRAPAPPRPSGAPSAAPSPYQGAPTPSTPIAPPAPRPGPA